jgi:integrase
VPLRISATDVAAYQAACADSGDSSSTIRRRSSALSSFFDFALRGDVVSENPVAGSTRPLVAVGDPSPTPRLRAVAVESMLQRAEELDPRLHALVALLALEGVKLGEALQLDVTDIRGRSGNVTADVQRAGQRHRLPLRTESGAAVRRCTNGRADGPLFLSGRPSSGTPSARLTRFGADHLIKRLPPHRGQPLTANALRRFFVTSSHAAGVELDEIRDRAGLADVRTARRYLARQPRVADQIPSTTNPTSAGHGSDRRATDKEE